MREAHAHDAVIRMVPDADLGAPGGAITLALCGSWDHQPPCPLAPHHTSVERVGEDVRVRVLYAAEPGAVPAVRAHIEAALRGQQVEGPDGLVTQWELRSGGPTRVRPEERPHAERLANE